MEVIIRPFTITDLGKVLEIERSCFSPSEAFSESMFGHFFKACPQGFFVAEENQKIIGYIVGCRKGKEGEVISLAVDPKLRRQGVGGTLLEFLLKDFREEGINTIELFVRIKNPGASKFYQKFGFEIIETVKDYYQDGADAYLMKLGKGVFPGRE